MANLQYLAQRSLASASLDVMKLKAFVPCKVEDGITKYKSTIVDIVFDPLRVKQINSKFKRAGFKFPSGTNVIAVNKNGSILLWGGMNSVFHLRKGEELNEKNWEKHLAFYDIQGLTRPFKIKNK